MMFCQRHWDMMRAAIEERGMLSLIVLDDQEAAKSFVDQILNGTSTDNFDPLMTMHWNIAGLILDKLGGTGLYLLGAGPEDRIDISKIGDATLREKYDGKTWPRCPVCYANIAHEMNCSNPQCILDKANGYDVCISWSADATKEQLDELMKGKP